MFHSSPFFIYLYNFCKISLCGFLAFSNVTSHFNFSITLVVGFGYFISKQDIDFTPSIIRLDKSMVYPSISSQY